MKTYRKIDDRSYIYYLYESQKWYFVHHPDETNIDLCLFHNLILFIKYMSGFKTIATYDGIGIMVHDHHVWYYDL